MLSYIQGRGRLVWALFFVLGLSGCATYSQTRSQIDASVAAGRYDEALKALDAQNTAERDRVLYLLDKAMLQRLAGDYRASNASFEEAKRVMDALAAASVSETATSFVINDATRSYGGEPFEQALLHVYSALNYLDMGDAEAARVEALQVDVKLKAFAEDDDGPLAVDPLARYLEGIVYEKRGEWSDALISYRKAYQAYLAHGKLYGIVVPASLKEDMLRLTARVGVREEHDKLRKEFGRKEWRAPDPSTGEVIILLHNGLAPIKHEHISVIYPPLAERVVSIALPYYEERRSPVAAARIVSGERIVRSDVAEDVSAIARHTLDGQMAGITARAIARMVAKYKLSEKAREESRGAGFAMNIAALFTERADTRSWLSLPGEVQIARMRLPAGDHRLQIELLSAAGSVIGTKEYDVAVTPGSMRVISYHYVPVQEARRLR